MEKETGDVTTRAPDVNQLRNMIQSNAVELVKKNKYILLTWATGCGKSLAALKMVDHMNKTLESGVSGYLICKEHSHLSNWEKDIEKHNMKHLLNDMTMFLYDSLHKYEGPVDYVILDECHAITEKRLEYLMDIVGESTVIIMLSATVNPEKLELLRALCKGPLVQSNITISEAIKYGLLPSPKLYVHFYGLNKTEHKEYHEITVELEKYRRKFFMNRDIWAKNKWVNLGSTRKRIMAEMKTKRAKELIEKEFKGSRFICFTGSKKQCEEIGGEKFVHSDLKSKEVIDKKDLFNEGKIDELYVVNMFRESINLVNVQKGLIVQLDNVKLSFIQMLGRVFRSEFPEMHIMVLKQTQDEKYYRNIIKGFNKEYIIVINH
jgi:superfamily II DNA or RNA helicase